MATERDTGLDSWKAMGAVVTVLLHTAITYASQAQTGPANVALQTITLWGVPLFLAISGSLQARKLGASDNSTRRGDWLKARVKRIITPYIAWTVVYLTAYSAMSLSGGNPIPAWNPLSVLLLGGAEPALWYLPATLIASATVLVVQPTRLLPAMLLLDVVFFVIDQPLTNNILISRLPLAIAATAAGYIINQRREESSRSRAYLWVGAALLLLAASMAFLQPHAAASSVDAALVSFVRLRLPWVAGVLFFMSARAVGSLSIASLAPLANWGLGIYLSHPLILRIIAALWSPSKAEEIPWIASAFLLASAAAVLLSVALGRRRLTRSIVC